MSARRDCGPKKRAGLGFKMCLVLVGCLIAASVSQVSSALAADEPSPELPTVRYHLTARPWSSMPIGRSHYLSTLQAACRAMRQFQDPQGAIIDPFLRREHQYSTPYYAYAVGTLLANGYAPELRESGIKAMDRATLAFAGGAATIPDKHGEFFIAPLAGALELYQKVVDEKTIGRWRERLTLPVDQVLEGLDMHLNNWRTYAMKGEWIRAQLGLVPRQKAEGFISDGWMNRGQRDRISSDLWSLYQDRLTNPESHAVEAVGRGNLLALSMEHYNGAHAEEISSLVERGTRVSAFLQDPTGQCPPNGRTDDHVFNDILYMLCFESLAVRAKQRGEVELSDRLHRAALLGYRSALRWRREDGTWAGSFYITKNRMDPGRRVGYQPASNFGNYNGAVMYHLAEACRLPIDSLGQAPAPAEIGGYAFTADPKFATAVANAGGLQLFFTLRGDEQPRYNINWSVLGLNRISRVDWDSRLGPSDGFHDFQSGRAASFCPVWNEGEKWFSVAEEHRRFDAEFSVQFVHPLLVRCSVSYKPKAADDAPSFLQEFIITPDGALISTSARRGDKFGVVLPVLTDDGRPLFPQFSSASVRTAFSPTGDEQCFIALNPQARVSTSPSPVLTTYGWVRPVRMTSSGSVNRIFIYPRNSTDPTAEQMQRSLRLTTSGFVSAVATVDGDTYVGRTSAGGMGTSLDLNSDGTPEVDFEGPCGSIVQLSDGQPTRIEADRAVSARVKGRRISLAAFSPKDIKH